MKNNGMKILRLIILLILIVTIFPALGYFILNSILIGLITGLVILIVVGIIILKRKYDEGLIG